MKIKNLIRVLSLAVISVGIVSFTPGDKTKKKNMNQVNVSDSIIQNIMTRTSVRTYQQRAVEPEKIETLLRAGMAAPSAVNRQPRHFVVVTDKAQLKALGGNGGPS
ncbi:MAG: nitroreductase family protein, partial [Bacteroidaceae bacterium]|nr:nitroreductase family protein [Bacteroidaceae bacterium]